MALFLATYDLNKAKDYQPLWDAFETLRAHKALRSTYLVDWDTTAEGLLDYLKQHIDGDDWLMVIEFDKKPEKYRCFKGTQDWIDARF